MALDKKRLVQVLGMTGSDGDGEALNAIRLANRMLRAANTTWSDLLAPPSAPASPDYRTPPSKRGRGNTSRYGRPASQKRYEDRERHSDDDIQIMFADLAARRMDMNTMMIVSSLNHKWEKDGWLNGAQRNLLENLYKEGRR
jgi:hypothetical protein